MAAPDVQIARVTDPMQDESAYRVLVDRLWPRGVRKDEIHYDRWLKDVAPSTDLRRWWAHDPERMDAFAERYRAELTEGVRADGLSELRALAAEHHRLTLLTATHDPEISHAAVLRSLLTAAPPRSGTR